MLLTADPAALRRWRRWLGESDPAQAGNERRTEDLPVPLAAEMAGQPVTLWTRPDFLARLRDIVAQAPKNATGPLFSSGTKE
jgi:hypothetical protein